MDKVLKNANTAYMYKYIRALLLSICCFFVSACHTTLQSNPQLNAHTPPSFDDFFEKSIIPLESETPTDESVWNNQSVDTSYIHPSKKLVALTFDDAPAKTLENILAVFAEYNESNPDCKATATLFLNGNLITEENTPTLHAAIALGFELGNHTQSHQDLTKLSAEELELEIDITDQHLSKLDGKPRHLLRAPFGHINPFIKSQVGTPIINWSIDTLDWTNVPSESIYNTIMDKISSGAIVLMHDGYPYTVEALKRLLPDLKKAGYQAVTVSALAKMHGCNLKNGSEYVRIRKQ